MGTRVWRGEERVRVVVGKGVDVDVKMEDIEGVRCATNGCVWFRFGCGDRACGRQCASVSQRGRRAERRPIRAAK